MAEKHSKRPRDPNQPVLSKLGHSIFQIRTERFISGILGVLRIRRFYLRKPSHRPVYILPNARREVSSGLRCPALRPFCLDTRGGELGHPGNAQRRPSGNTIARGTLH